ncbi:hypothetical protein Taro_037699 [Colocasia esculenta]|uniref:Uncharacterized protein n=1 Tax=Colocasia esculenta TaxID=4460 RepID=A0A843WH07_COLES|nr:hypothetical protein [Colocasia esculenta]
MEGRRVVIAFGHPSSQVRNRNDPQKTTKLFSFGRLEEEKLKSHHHPQREATALTIGGRVRFSPVDMGKDRKNCVEDGFFKLILDVLHIVLMAHLQLLQLLIALMAQTLPMMALVAQIPLQMALVALIRQEMALMALQLPQMALVALHFPLILTGLEQEGL